MTFRFHERPVSRSTTHAQPSYTANYMASGTNDAAFVKSFALAATPAVVSTVQGTLYRQDLQIESQGHELFYITVPYGPRKNETGQFRLTFDTTGGTVHITASKETVGKFPSDAANHKQLIGVHGDNVDGTDIVIPALRISVVFRHPLGMITIPQIKNLAGYTGCVNSDTFLTFAPGEVLFLGASGSEGSDAETEVTYQFACSQNVSGLSIGDVASVVKKGHEVAWIAYKDDTDDGKPVKRPQAVYVERVYDTIAMSTSLGFGG